MRISIDFFYLAVLLSAIAWSTKGALRFTEKPNNNVFAEKGTTVILKWDYSADNKSAELQNIIWTAGISVLMYENSTGYWKISGAIPSSYVGRVSKEGPAFLVIKGVTFEDSGSYTCTLEATPGVTQDETSTVNLVVTGVEPKIHFRKVGNSATFTCNATGIPSQNFTWTKLGSKVEIVNDAQHSVDFLSGSSVLTIKIITVEDQAYYICNATIGDDQQNLGSAYLQLVSDMSLSYESCPNLPYNVRVGRRELKLCCPVGGYPKPTITWERNGIQLQKSENPLYFISNVQQEDFGNYTCTATDGKSVIASAVSVRDKIANLPVETTDGTDKEAANLTWTQQTGADYYVVAINGPDILPDVLIGKQTSLEVHYHTLVMKNNKEDAPETTVCVEVSALNSTAGVIAKTKDPSCKTMVIKKTSDTVY